MSKQEARVVQTPAGSVRLVGPAEDVEQAESNLLEFLDSLTEGRDEEEEDEDVLVQVQLWLDGTEDEWPDVEAGWASEDEGGDQ